MVTNRGLYEPKVMYFGMTNSPAAFEALMNSVFTYLIAKGQVVVYIDDILPYSRTLKEHGQVVHKVLKWLEHYDLYLKPEQCEFEKDSMEYLGMIICPQEVQMDTGKVTAVKDWPTPTMFKEVRAFIEFANFYRRFVKDFSTMARPLHDLTKKDVPWHWSKEQQEAFETIKRTFCDEPIHKVCDPDLPTHIEVDASGFAAGGIQSQKHDDGLWHPVAYHSESMSKEEHDNEIYNQEMLGLICALEDWRHFLKGLEFKVITDHKNMEWWSTLRDLNRQQAHWSLYQSCFNFKVTYKKGKSMQANTLSRFSTDHISDREDNHQEQVLGPQHFLTVAAAHYKPANNSLGDHICQASVREAEVINSFHSIDKTAPKALTNGTALWEEEDSFVYHKGKLYIPNVKELCHDIVKTCHNSITTGHPGKNGTIELVSHHYWWPHMGGFITAYIKGCDKCQRY